MNNDTLDSVSVQTLTKEQKDWWHCCRPAHRRYEL